MEIEEQIQEVLGEYPELSYSIKNKAFSGKLNIDEEDEYEVIIWLYDFPNNFPVVFESGERIPKKARRHIFEKTGNCCFTTTAKEEILLKQEVFTVKQFIDKIVVPYFQNNSYFELNKEYKYGEYSHSLGFATHETYKDILDVNDIYLMEQILTKRLSSIIRISENSKCYCNRDIKIKYCKNHLKRWLDFITISKKTIKSDLENIKKLIVELEEYKAKEKNDE